MSPLRLKTCSGPCGLPKLLDEFWKDSKQPDGRQARCITCSKQARAALAERRRNGDDTTAVSPELRRERSERAKKLHEEGRFGGAKFGQQGGRPRKPKMTDAVLEHFQQNLPLIIKAFESNLRSRSKSQRERAAEFLIGLEQQEDKRLREVRGQGKDPADMTHDELVEFVTRGLMAQIGTGDIDLKGVIDLAPDDVVEIEADAA